MADLFVSWGSPDRKAVQRLKQCLVDVGLDLFEYTDEMRAGDEIPKRVLEEIHKAKLAILCISERTVSRKWLERELHWCYSDLVAEERPMKALLPIQVGALPRDKVPSLISETNFYLFDLSDPATAEADLNRLIGDIHQKLGEPRPIFIPATIFAMTRDECSTLLNAPAGWERLRELCRAAGMHWQNGAPADLLRRYGDSPEKFSPFFDHETIKEMIESAVRMGNEHRALRKAHPVSLHWYRRSLLVSDSDELESARDHWRYGSHLLVVDSISMLEATIRQDFLLMPQSSDERRRALVWVPPYTRHTVMLENLTHQAARMVPHLSDAFRDWTAFPERSIAFDTANGVALRRWVNQAVHYLAAPPLPIESIRSDIEREFSPVGLNPGNMNRQGTK